MKYIPTIGMEIHAELKTKTKMFCGSLNDPDEKKPNVNICPVCMGHPGTLPVINKEAVRQVLRVGLALGGKISDFTEFDRKNYFYPDIPKGYQISQYKFPLITGGILNGVFITRVHLEEDTAKSWHDPKTGESFIDFNRAGVPLMELVTEPAIHSAKEAADFARELQLLLRYLDASEANMEKGEMRVEVNISISDKRIGLGTKVEIKNLNSFKSVEKAIAYEIERQSKLLELEQSVSQETRGWDEIKEITFSQRSKEYSHDYRYFPDPDLPKLRLGETEEFKNLEKTLPELPRQKRERYEKEFGIKTEHIELYVQDRELGKYFEEMTKLLMDKKDVALASNYIASDILGNLGNVPNLAKPAPEELTEIVKMLAAGEISSRGAKNVLLELMKGGKDPKIIAAKSGLMQRDNEEELRTIVSKVISSHPEVASEYKTGKEKSLQYLIGQAMKESGGAANPQILEKMLKARLLTDKNP